MIIQDKFSKGEKFVKIENLTVGMRIRNYQDLCILIEEKIRTGKSKQLQVQRWEQYFRYHRDGYAFIIDEIYEKPLPPPPRKLRSDNIYTELIEIILMDKLLTDHSMRIGRVELYQLLGFCNDNYANTNLKDFKNIMQQFQENGITGRLMTADEAQSYYMDFSNFARNKFNDILMSALESMQRRNLIIYRKTFLIVEEIYGKHITRDANKEEECEILELISEFLKNNPQYYHVNTYMIYAYYAELNKWIRKNKKDWFAAYPVMCITINDNQEFMKDDINKVNKQIYREFTNDTCIGEKKLELNRIIIERFNKHFKDKFEIAKNDNRVLQEDWIQWGESNKMNSEKIYTPDFQEAQSSLIDLFIKIENDELIGQDNENNIMEEFKMNNLKLVRTENFENTIPCDFWGDVNGEYFVTRDQIGTALGYSNPEIAISKIHNRHKGRLDKYSTLTKLGSVESGRYVERERTLYSRKGIMEICRWSSKPLADKFMDWCWEVIDSLILKNTNQNTEFASLIDGILKQNSLILSQNRSLENKVTRLENMISSLVPPKKYSNWKNQIGIKIKSIAKQLGLETESEIKAIYGEIYNIMRNDYGLDVNSYKGDYLKNHADVVKPFAIDIVDDYAQLKSLFESIVENYIEIKIMQLNN